MTPLRKSVAFSLPFILGVFLVGNLFSIVEAESENIITVCPAFCAYTTIQGAVVGAEANDLIVVNSGIYTENIVITKSLRLLGEGAETTIIDGNELDRVVTIDADVAVEMTGFTLQRGRAPLDEDGHAMGGGVFNLGELSLMETAVISNVAKGASGHDEMLDGAHGYGGGIFNGCAISNCGSLSLRDVLLRNNLAEGGIGRFGTENDTHGSGGDGYGGATYNQCDYSICGKIIISATQIISNRASGGAAESEYDYDDYDYGFESGGDARGGASYNDCILARCATIKIMGSLLQDNKAVGGSGYAHGGTAAGGAIHNMGTLTLTGSTLTGNNAFGGLYEVIYKFYFIGGDGGGISTSGYLKINDSAIFNNQSGGRGGGVFSVGQSYTEIENSTISDNNSDESGGGIQNEGELHLNFVTVGNNVAGPGVLPSGGGLNNLGQAYIQNSILAQNWAHLGYRSFSLGPDCQGELISEGYNLIQDTSDCTITGDSTGNILGQASYLYPIAYNGGPTWTQALWFTSPAIDAADSEDCLAYDQRGVARPKDGDDDGTAVCDIGAFEGVILPTEFSYLPIIIR